MSLKYSILYQLLGIHYCRIREHEMDIYVVFMSATSLHWRTG